MSIVDFNTGIWTDPWFRKLEVSTKFLFIYLWTNNHRFLTGLYPLDIDTMSFETGLPNERIGFLLDDLNPKVKYDKENEIVWVVNHVKHQFMKNENISPKIIKKLEKDLRTLPQDHHFIEDFLQQYNTLSLNYRYPIRDTEYPSGKGKGKDTGKGEEEKKSSSFNEKGKLTANDNCPTWDEICSGKQYT